jgi:hypothetical protein
MEYLKTVGTDGIRLLAKLDDPEAAPRSLKQLPEEVEILHRIWEQQYGEIEGGSGYSTQKRCLKPPAASDPPTKRRPTTPLRAL